jgi:hypothetical protein
MTWGRLQKLTEALLAGDHTLVKEPESRIALLQYAYEDLGNLAQVLAWETEDTSIPFIRQWENGIVLRRPSLPTSDDEELDVDEGLTFAVARLMASYVSKMKYNLHKSVALEIIETYNNKVESYREATAPYGVGMERTYIKEDQYE